MTILIETKLGKFKVTILDPKIIVFHDVLSDPSGLIDYYEKNTSWRGWFAFGRQVDQGGPTIATEEFPTELEWQSYMINSTEDIYRKEIALSFFKASKEYATYTKTSLPNWICKNWSLARYLPNENIIKDTNLTMNYHTDYQHSKHDQPGEKFGITAVLYPNDEYDGGEISFRVASKDWKIEKEIDYKPRSGDLVFFPAEHPYYHGVRRLENSAKYIVRLYWQYDSPGTKEWHDLYKKYGDAFRDLENTRVNRHDLMFTDPFLRPKYAINEYYEHLENGTLPDDSGE
jgi:hypothetical protein